MKLVMLLCACMIAIGGCTISRNVTMPSGKIEVERCTRYYVPYYAIVVIGVLSFDAGCHIVNKAEEDL